MRCRVALAVAAGGNTSRTKASFVQHREWLAPGALDTRSRTKTVSNKLARTWKRHSVPIASAEGAEESQRQNSWRFRMTCVMRVTMFVPLWGREEGRLGATSNCPSTARRGLS
jgi:hypothetical protein